MKTILTTSIILHAGLTVTRTDVAFGSPNRAAVFLAGIQIPEENVLEVQPHLIRFRIPGDFGPKRKSSVVVGETEESDRTETPDPSEAPPPAVPEKSAPRPESIPSPSANPDPSPRTDSESGRGLSVLAIDIPDMSAIDVLAHLDTEPAEKYDLYTGAGFGGFISLLLASGCAVSDIRQALAEKGQYIAKRGVTRPVRDLMGGDPRLSFAHLDHFFRGVVKDVDALEVRHLEGDVYFPVINPWANLSGVISKSSTGELSVLSAARVVCSTFHVYEPLELADPLPSFTGALSAPGLVWNHVSIGKMCPDLRLARDYEFRISHFRSFVRPMAPSAITTRKMKKAHLIFPHIKSLEIGLLDDAELTTETMKRIFGDKYRRTILPASVFDHNYDQSKIEASLGTRALSIDRF